MSNVIMEIISLIMTEGVGLSDFLVYLDEDPKAIGFVFLS